MSGRVNRQPIAGACVSIDGDSWHRDGEHCEHCGFGLDDFGDGSGFWHEPLIAAPAWESGDEAAERRQTKLDMASLAY
jgi:hypothetical protein